MNVIQRDDAGTLFGEFRVHIIGFVGDMAIAHPQHGFARLAATQCEIQGWTIDPVATVARWYFIDHLATIGKHPKIWLAC